MADYLRRRERALDLRAFWLARGTRASPAHAVWLARVAPDYLFDAYVPARDTRVLPLP